MIVPDVGGAFGSKGTLPVETPLVALAALELGRPVKWAEDRRENLARRAAGPRAARGGRARARRRRPDPRPARPHARRPRRLPAAEHGDPAAHDGDAAERLLRHPGGRGDRHRRAHQQGADRALPRRRPAGGDLPDRDDDRRRRARARDRRASSCAGATSCARSRTGPRSAGRTTPATSSAASTRALELLARTGVARRPRGPLDGRPRPTARAGSWASPPPRRAARRARRHRRRAVRRALGRPVRARDRAARGRRRASSRVGSTPTGQGHHTLFAQIAADAARRRRRSG